MSQQHHLTFNLSPRFSHILSGSKIGQNCVIGPDVTIGNKCKIQNNMSVYKGVTFEDGVFCGPSILDRPIESETCKIVENSYRATILAFLNEWSLFAKRNGVDLIKVIQAIKVRPTHSNMIFPGPGIGGYCLPKDGDLGVLSYNTLLVYRMVMGVLLQLLAPTQLQMARFKGHEIGE